MVERLVPLLFRTLLLRFTVDFLEVLEALALLAGLAWLLEALAFLAGLAWLLEDERVRTVRSDRLGAFADRVDLTVRP